MSILHAPSLFVIPLFAGEHKNRENLKQEAIVEVLSKQKKIQYRAEEAYFAWACSEQWSNGLNASALVQRNGEKPQKLPCTAKKLEHEEAERRGRQKSFSEVLVTNFFLHEHSPAIKRHKLHRNASKHLMILI